jgi:hypothetical protein
MPRTIQWTFESAHERLRELHEEWCGATRDGKPFDYKYLRTADPGLVSFLDHPRYLGHLSGAFARSGINPSCHIRKLDYGSSEQERRMAAV